MTGGPAGDAAGPLAGGPAGDAGGPLAGVLQAPGTVWASVDTGGVVRRVGPGVGPVLGLRPEAVAGHRGLLFVHRGDLPVAAAAAARVMAGDEVAGVVLRIRHGDGGWRRIRFAARLGGDGTATVLGRDVTAQHQARQDAAGQEVLLRDLLDHMPMAVWVKDLTGAYRFVNREFCRLAGFSTPDDVVGLSTEEVWPASSELIRANEAAVPVGEGTFEELMQTVDGLRTFLTVRRVVTDAQGRPQATAGVATDISERAEAEAALAERTRVLDAILATSPDIIALVGRRGEVVRHNTPAVGLLGERRRDVRLDDALSLVHPDDVDAVTTAFAELSAGATEQAVSRYRLRHQDGHWVTVDSRGRAERDADGRVAGMVVVTRDVSADLAAETRLRAAVASAEAASQAKSVFLSRMSHELRTPLNSILGFAQLLEMDDLSADRAADVEVVLAAGRRLLSLIDEVLDLARIETGHLNLESSAVPPGTALAAAAGPGDTVVVADGTDEVWVDERRLRQVLDTLVAVGRQAAGGGPLRLAADPAVPGWVRLSVAPAPGTGGPDAPAGLDAPAGPVAPGEADAPAGPDAPAGLDAPAGPDAPAQAAAQPGDRPEIALALARYLVDQMDGRMVDAGPPGLAVDVPSAAAAAAGVPAAQTAAGAAAGPADAPVALRVVAVTADDAATDLLSQLPERRPGVAVQLAADEAATGRLAGAGDVDLLLLDGPDPARSPTLQALRLAPGHRPLVALVVPPAAAASARRLLGDAADAVLAAPLDGRAVLDLLDAAAQMARSRPSQ